MCDVSGRSFALWTAPRTHLFLRNQQKKEDGLAFCSKCPHTVSVPRVHTHTLWYTNVLRDGRRVFKAGFFEKKKLKKGNWWFCRSFLSDWSLLVFLSSNSVLCMFFFSLVLRPCLTHSYWFITLYPLALSSMLLSCSSSDTFVQHQTSQFLKTSKNCGHFVSSPSLRLSNLIVCVLYRYINSRVSNRTRRKHLFHKMILPACNFVPHFLSGRFGPAESIFSFPDRKQ